MDSEYPAKRRRRRRYRQWSCRVCVEGDGVGGTDRQRRMAKSEENGREGEKKENAAESRRGGEVTLEGASRRNVTSTYSLSLSPFSLGTPAREFFLVSLVHTFGSSFSSLLSRSVYFLSPLLCWFFIHINIKAQILSRPPDAPFRCLWPRWSCLTPLYARARHSGRMRRVCTGGG